ncbi:MAG: aminotransferase class I/II-fold pyridoxal phosphate-dependent enzyme [Patescibacteria group bacterium]
MKIPLNRPTITKKDAKSFKKLAVLDIFSDEAIKKFENKFAGYIGRKYAISTNSGTSALHLALLALDIKEKDEVICPSYTCVALLNAISYVKAEVKLVDCNFNVEKSDFNISFLDLKKKISLKTKVIIVPHMFGFPAEIEKIIKFGIPVIEDATQSLGGEYLSKKLGSYGAISIFSVHSSKMMTTGSGGVFLTDSKDLFEKAKFLGDYESTIVAQRLKKPDSYNVQYNYKISDLNAYLGTSQLDQLNQFVKKRKNIAKAYGRSLKSVAKIPFLSKENIFWRYMIEINKNPIEVIKEATKYGIEIGRGVYPPLHQYLKMRDDLFKNTKKATSSLIALPIYPSMTAKEINYLMKILIKIL